MATLLKRGAPLLLALCSASALAAESDRHQWRIELEAAYSSADSPLASWPSGGFGKLRYAENDDAANAVRVLAEYRGRITPTLSTTVVADYQDDASSGFDIDEAFIDWRPIPKSPTQQQLRMGLFYPPLSLENTSPGWQSPFTYSFSAINTWYGEEVRPLGVEWSMRRKLGVIGSPHELRAFAAGFVGNDPTGTLLFWRGWSLHDRQTRLNDEIGVPPLPELDAFNQLTGYSPQVVEPIEEIDREPGAYAGIEWRYARRALVQLAHWDNRADPWAFRDGQWAWRTKFSQIGTQLSLPGDFGLVAQWLDGYTDWVAGVRQDGSRAWPGGIVRDGFESWFVLLTRVVQGKHRISLRYDEFEIVRDQAPPALVADDGDAWTLAYRYDRSERLSGGIEWLEIDSGRDLWSAFYGLPHEAKERQLRLQISLKYGAPQAAR